MIDVEWMLARSTWEPNSGCLLWLGSVNGHGYGQLSIDGKNKRAHRVMYELDRGEIPSGLVLDHKCRTRSCINPDHLEPVTNKENVMRGVGLCAVNAKKTHCKRGHSLSGNNLNKTLLARGERWCRQCKNELQNTIRRHRRGH